MNADMWLLSVCFVGLSVGFCGLDCQVGLSPKVLSKHSPDIAELFCYIMRSLTYKPTRTLLREEMFS